MLDELTEGGVRSEEERQVLAQRVERVLLKLHSLGYSRESRLPELEKERECFRVCCDPNRPMFVLSPFMASPAEYFADEFCSSATCVELLGAFVAASRTVLSLRELARNAVRTHVGGVHFAARTRALHLPSSLLCFIILPAAGAL